jgi:tRNA(fMet)-specific endonuclease VapC
MRYLLDTNIVSDLVVCTSIIVTAELRYGAIKKGSSRLARQLEAVLGARDVFPLTAPADTVYGKICTRLEQTGTPIGGNDLLIAA